MYLVSRNTSFLNLSNYCKLLILKQCTVNGKATAATTTATHEKCSATQSRGLILGVYSDEEDKLDVGLLTQTAWVYNQHVTQGRLLELLRLAGPMPKRGELRVFYDLEPNFAAVAVCGLGHKCLGYDSHELIDEGKEAIRTASALGCRFMQELDMYKISVESFGNTEASAEGAGMGIWAYQKMKSPEKAIKIPTLEFHVENNQEYDYDGWKVGLEKASAQNLARTLMETPSNLLTPTKFARDAVNVLCDSGVNVEVKVRGWAETQQMNAFLNVAKGSSEPPIFMELSYYGSDPDEPPIVLIGQGTTFNSGGLNLQPCEIQQDMRGDMAGAAVVVAACRAIATLRLPINIRGLIPLCEHMIGCNAIKPGDVVKAKNGKHLNIEMPDRCSSLIMTDALIYAQTFCPKYIIDVGTVHQDIMAAFGKACTGAFTNSEQLWIQFKIAAAHTGDRVWRMPLWNHYSKQVADDKATVDVENLGVGRNAVSCKTAAILREFTPCVPWMHLDALGVMTTSGDEYTYLRKGMTGRPTRTLIEFIAQSICNGIDPTGDN